MINKLAIVGNGDVNNDYSSLIDNCDHIIRFNRLQSLNRNLGQRTTGWVIANKNPLLKELAQDILYNWKDSRLAMIKKITSLYFPIPRRYPFVTEHEYQQECSQRCADITAFLETLSINKTTVDVVTPPQKHVTDLDPNSWPPESECPSSGYLMIRYFLDMFSKEEYEINVFGFTWKGWAGHPWNLEQTFLHKLQLNNKLFIH